METVFWIRLGLSFVVGSVWVTLATVLAERFGSRAGGLIGGLPSTSLVALLFIGITQSAETAAASTTVVPMAQSMNGLFIVFYLLMIRRGLARAVFSALGIWFVGGLGLVLWSPNNFFISIMIWILVVPAVCILVEKGMCIPSVGGRKVHYTFFQIVLRACFGGVVIAFAVFMGKAGGAVWGGLFATFPSLFLSTLIISYLSGGAVFSRAIAKSIMVSGLITVPFYAIFVRIFYPELGLMVGTLVSAVCSVAVGYGTFRLIKRLT